MMHPETFVKEINPTIGVGVFAKEFIPKGTITYVVDKLDIRLPRIHTLVKSSLYRESFDKYSYRLKNGVRVLSWDHAKYLNHSCAPNTLSTGWGFEIAVEDIQAGEEITCDYGLLNIEYPMQCGCQSQDCRELVEANPGAELIELWDDKVKSAIKEMRLVDQPLVFYMSTKLSKELAKSLDTEKYLSVGSNLLSVNLRYATAW